MFAVAPDLTTIGLWKAQHMVSAISQTWQKKQKFIQSSVKKDVNFLGNSNKLKNNKCSQTSSEIKTSLCPRLSSNALYIALTICFPARPRPQVRANGRLQLYAPRLLLRLSDPSHEDHGDTCSVNQKM